MNRIRNAVITSLNEEIAELKGKGYDIDGITDGYHTFGELYDFRLAYNANLFNAWALDGGLATLGDDYSGVIDVAYAAPLYDVHKSWKHHDGEFCFGSERKWFIVSAKLPTGLISNHYKAEHWSKFQVPIAPKALYEYDGHTAQDVLTRLNALLQ